jgi:hypothetical protein
MLAKKKTMAFAFDVEYLYILALNGYRSKNPGPAGPMIPILRYPIR